jgi:hypothetical protein
MQMPMQMPMQQPMQMEQPPVGFNLGGDVALEAYRQGAPEPSLGQQFGAVQQRAMGQPVDITATPTPRDPVDVPDIATLVRRNLGDDEEAQQRFNELEGALTNPEATNEDRKAAITGAAGVENTRDGFRSVVSQITGRDIPASATVDELNQAITGVALGGAIGGPRSVAERISQALLTGLDAQRQTAMGREQFEQQLSLEAFKGSQETPKGFLETPRGKAAVEMYQNFLQNQNMLPEQAYARMDSVTPGLGEELEAAMAGISVAQLQAGKAEKAQILQEAREAIASGEYDRTLIVQALIDAGVDPAEL